MTMIEKGTIAFFMVVILFHSCYVDIKLAELREQIKELKK